MTSVNKKRVLLQINVTANWGSTGKIAELIGLLAMQNGWDSYIAYGRMMNPSKSQLIKIGSQMDVYQHYVMGHFFDMEGLISKRATKELIQKIKKIKPDVIHLHNIHDHYLNYSILFEYLAKNDIPVVWTQHDQWAATGGCCYVPDDCEKWRTGCCDCPLRHGMRVDRSIINYFLKKESFSSVKSLTLVPVSEWLGGMLKESFLGKGEIQVIHNGIDTNIFCPTEATVHQQYNIVGKKIVLGVASEWSERKGLPDMLKLAYLLPKDEYVVVIVGKILKKLTLEKNKGCPVIFIDRTQNVHELVQIYSAASVYVNPTYQDNYPTTNLEAMACGTPVVTYDTGGSPEPVSAETGMVVEQGNITTLLEAVKQVCERDCKEYDIACRKRAVEYFDKDKCFEKYIELYRELT